MIIIKKELKMMFEEKQELSKTNSYSDESIKENAIVKSLTKLIEKKRKEKFLNLLSEFVEELNKDKN